MAKAIDVRKISDAFPDQELKIVEDTDRNGNENAETESNDDDDDCFVSNETLVGSCPMSN